MYLYKDCSAQRAKEVEAALEKDWTLREKLAVLKASMNRLDKIVESPRTEVVLSLLNKARQRFAQPA